MKPWPPWPWDALIEKLKKKVENLKNKIKDLKAQIIYFLFFQEYNLFFVRLLGFFYFITLVPIIIILAILWYILFKGIEPFYFFLKRNWNSLRSRFSKKEDSKEPDSSKKKDSKEPDSSKKKKNSSSEKDKPKEK